MVYGCNWFKGSIEPIGQVQVKPVKSYSLANAGGWSTCDEFINNVFCQLYTTNGNLLQLPQFPGIKECYVWTQRIILKQPFSGLASIKHTVWSLVTWKETDDQIVSPKCACIGGMVCTDQTSSDLPKVGELQTFLRISFQI